MTPHSTQLYVPSPSSVMIQSVWPLPWVLMCAIASSVDPTTSRVTSRALYSRPSLATGDGTGSTEARAGPG